MMWGWENCFFFNYVFKKSMFSDGCALWLAGCLNLKGQGLMPQRALDALTDHRNRFFEVRVLPCKQSGLTFRP